MVTYVARESASASIMSSYVGSCVRERKSVIVLWSSALSVARKPGHQQLETLAQGWFGGGGQHRTLPTEHGIDTEIGAVYTVFGDKGNGLSSKFLDPWALCAHLDPMPRR